jgi:hypothetical protein
LRAKYGADYWKSDEFKALQEERAEQFRVWKQLTEAIPSPLTALVEVKVTRSDFQRDDKWLRPSPVNLRYLAVPKGMLKPEEYPVGWFVLEFNNEGKLLKLSQQGSLEKVDIERQMWIIHEIALRRHHRTEHTWMRDTMKRFNASQTEQRQDLRIRNVVGAIVEVIEGHSYGKTPEEIFSFRRIPFDKLTHWDKEKLKLWHCKGKNFQTDTVQPNLRPSVEGD